MRFGSNAWAPQLGLSSSYKKSCRERAQPAGRPKTALGAKMIYISRDYSLGSTSICTKRPNVIERFIVLAFLVGGAVSTISCQKKDRDPTATTDIQETAQQIGDAMASIDESGGSSGGLAFNEISGNQRTFARLLPTDNGWAAFQGFYSFLVPKANATTCLLANTFGSCTSNVITRDFGGCTIGASTLTGTVTLTWSDAAVNNICAIAADGHSITRVPSFTLTGRRGGTLTVSKTGTNGQVISRTGSGQFSFANDGIRRVITYRGSTLFDYTTETSSPLSISGSSRNGRTLTSSGGAGLKVTNNSSGVVCTYIPTNVTWTNSCTCATSGSWSATCSDGRSSVLTINGCATGSFTMGIASESLTFDRCYGG